MARTELLVNMILIGCVSVTNPLCCCSQFLLPETEMHEPWSKILSTESEMAAVRLKAEMGLIQIAWSYN